MTPVLYLTRKISISGSHRLSHGIDNCASIHGHNFDIEASVTLLSFEEEKGLSINLRDIKSALMEVIHHHADHAMLLNVEDPLLRKLISVNVDDNLAVMRKSVEDNGFYTNIGVVPNPLDFSQRIFLMKGDPTLENLTVLFLKMLTKFLQKNDPKYGVKYALSSLHIKETDNNSVHGVI